MAVATAFVGLDYIVDIMHPSGKAARSAAQALQRGVIAKANAILAHGRIKGWLNILVKVGFAENYADQPKTSRMFGHVHEIGALALGTPGTAFHPDLNVSLADLVIVKPRISAFYGTNLDAVLRARRIDRLAVAGVSTAWAVQSTVRDAHDRDYDVIVVEDACAAANEQIHRSSVELLEDIAQVIQVDDLERL